MTAETSLDQGQTRKESTLRERCDAVTQTLLDELGAGKTREVERYLELTANFPDFSLYNQHLLFAQRPDATTVATFETWNAHGWSITHGEKALHIVDGKTKRPVFDLGQVWPHPNATQLPRFMPARADPREMTVLLAAALHRRGIERPAAPAPLDMHLQTRRTPRAMGATLEFLRYCLGFADALLYPDDEHTGVSAGQVHDGQVEATAFVVARHFGLEVPFLGSDLERWGQTPEALRTDLERVRRVSAEIIRELRTPEYRMELEQFTQLHYPLQSGPLRPDAQAFRQALGRDRSNQMM